jgi:hypothetical protein
MGILKKILDVLIYPLTLNHPKEPPKRELPKNTLSLTDGDIGIILAWYEVANLECGVGDRERALRNRIVNAISNDSLRDYYRNV